MNMSFRANRYFIVIFILSILLLFFACSAPPTQPASPDEPAAPSETITTPSDNSSKTQYGSTGLPARVDVVYFHRPQRCATCLCFEERIRYVVGAYFQEELNSGQMTFGVYDIGDSKNNATVKKYGAIASQLFINVVKDGTDNIKDIQDIWSWSCRTDKPGFDRQVKNLIEQSLTSEE